MTDVATPSQDYEDMRARWKQMRDVVEGSTAVKAAGTTYLPALGGHRKGTTLTQEYEDYKDRALFYGATGRTVDGLSGMVFRQPPIVGLPSAADQFRKDVDMGGRKIEEFADAVLREMLTTGRIGILVDYTRQEDFSGGDVGTPAPTEQRPYMTLYATEAILDVVYERVGGARKLVQTRLAETLEVPSATDEFDTNTVQIVRVLEIADGNYRQRVFEAVEEEQRQPNGQMLVVTTWREREDLEVTPTGSDGRPFDFIPFWIVGTGASAIPGEIEPPPLLDLSDVNLCHYRQDADYRNALHVAGVPTPVFTGMSAPDEPLKLGTKEGIFIENPDAKFGFLAYGAEGVEAIKGALADLEQQMAFLGARMLQPDKRGVEAAETARIHRMGEISILARLSNVISNNLTTATLFMLAWAGIATNDDHQVRLSDDFLPTQAPSPLLQQMRETWKVGGISFDSFWRFMQEGELVDPRRTPEEEQAIIEQEDRAEAEREMARRAEFPELQPPALPPEQPPNGEAQQQEAA